MAALLDGDLDAMGALLPESVLELEGQRDRYLLPGLGSPQEIAAHGDRWPDLVHWLVSTSTAGDRTDVLLDLGRIGSIDEPAPLLDAADVTVIVCRTDLPSVMGAMHALAHLTTVRALSPERCACLLVGERQPYSRREVEASLELPVVAALDWDPQSAAVLSHGVGAGRGFVRGRLMRTAAPVARALANWAAMASGVDLASGLAVEGSARG
jgi:hypothetical protein